MISTVRSFLPPRSQRHRRPPRVSALVVVALLLAASPARSQDAPGELLVLAASSLTEVLPRVAAAWRAAEGSSVRFSFDATSRLAPQAVSGARADVFFSADEEWMRWLEERGAVEPGSARPVGGNELVLVVPAGSAAPPAPADLPGVGRVALAGENVPAGRYAEEALRASGVWAEVEPQVVRGGSVRSVLQWVARAEVPAGVVYRTDAVAEPAVEVAFSFPAAGRAVTYWAAPLATSRDPGLAAAFLGFTTGPEAQEIFAAAGFTPPSAQASLGPSAVPSSLPSVSSAIRLSLWVALLATVLGFVPAVAVGWVLARHDFPGKAILSTVVLAPLVIPPVVTGFLLLSLLGTQSPLGRMLASLGLPVPFTLLGATVAALVVGLPLYVISIRGAFEAVDPLYEELSWTLGVPPRRTFFRVSLPLAFPGIVAGAVLAFARALGEFGATVVLAGNVEGSTRTIALAVYTLLESPAGRETTWMLVGASVLLSLVALLGFETLSRRQRRRMEDRYVR